MLLLAQNEQDNYDVCLSSKCFCDHFASKENQSKGKIQKEHVAKKEVDQEDQHVSVYIQTIAKI